MLPYIIPHLQHIAASNLCDCHGSCHAEFVSGRIEQARFYPENTQLSMHALQRTSPTPYNNDRKHLKRCNPKNVAVFITTKDLENQTNVLHISHKVIERCDPYILVYDNWNGIPKCIVSTSLAMTREGHMITNPRYICYKVLGNFKNWRTQPMAPSHMSLALRMNHLNKNACLQCFVEHSTSKHHISVGHSTSRPRALPCLRKTRKWYLPCCRCMWVVRTWRILARTHVWWTLT